VPLVNRQIALRQRPQGPVSESDFIEQTVPVPALDEGQLLLKNAYLSIDPAIRQWIGGRGRYIAPIGPGDAVRSIVLGQVAESRLPGFAEGDWVRALGAWEEYSVVGKRDFPFRIASGDAPAPTAHLGVLGGAGLAAYFGLIEIGNPKSGETVAVSSAAGAVGSIVCQLARNRGCRVVGITGSEEKAAWLREVCGVTATINYHAADLREAFKAACPDGIDIYFDNAGGDLLEAALARLNRGGRVVLCGATASYDSAEPPKGPSNYLCLLEQGARMEGFMASQFLPQFGEVVAFLEAAFGQGRLHFQEHTVDGLASAPGALVRVMSGSITGRLLVRVEMPHS